jgi:hypothetical protein
MKPTGTSRLGMSALVLTLGFFGTVIQGDVTAKQGCLDVNTDLEVRNSLAYYSKPDACFGDVSIDDSLTTDSYELDKVTGQFISRDTGDVVPQETAIELKKGT